MAKQIFSAREAAVRIVRRLVDAGHVAYLAGGCVRDRLLGQEPKDYDVATDAPPDKVHELFSSSRFVGEAFGVVLVRQGAYQVEVATFRTEGRYEDGRRPSVVSFTTAEQDAKRRDFTINGLFEDPLAECETNRVIDYVGGVADLRERVLRTIGSAWSRFDEDYLRMLRAARFAARFGLSVERATHEAIVALAGKLSQISRERIGQEMQWMLEGPAPAASLRLVETLKLDAPALNEAHMTSGLRTVDALSSDGPWHVYLAAWMIDRHVMPTADRLPSDHDALPRLPAGLVGRWRRALCLSNEVRDAVRSCIAALAELMHWQQMSEARKMRLLAHPAWSDGWRLAQALRHLPMVEAQVDAMSAEVAELSQRDLTPPPLINGEDLITAGVAPGPQMGRLLAAAYDAQLEGRLSSRAAALRWVQEQQGGK